MESGDKSLPFETTWILTIGKRESIKNFKRRYLEDLKLRSKIS